MRKKAEEEEQAPGGKAAQLTGEKAAAIEAEAEAAAAAAAAAHLQAKSEEVSQAFSLVLSLSRPLLVLSLSSFLSFSLWCA